MDWRELRESVEAAYEDYLSQVNQVDDGQIPHCDDLVLHAPGECIYCDEHADRQALRQEMKIDFTGHRTPGFRQCPADACRPTAKIERWHGNIPMTKELQAEEKQYWDELTEKLRDLNGK